MLQKQFFKYVLPSMLSFAFTGVYAIVDGWFLGKNMGDMGLAAINIAYPITAFIQAVGTGIGMGGAIQISVCEGRRDPRGQKEHLGNTLLLLIGACDVLTGGLFFAARPLLHLFGAQGELLEYAHNYIEVIILGAVFQIFSTGLLPLIRNFHATLLAMFSMIAGFATNIVLDWLFVSVLQYEMEGAALATIIGQAVTLLPCLFFLIRKKYLTRYAVYRPIGRVVREILVVGISPFGLTLSPNIAIIILNKGAVLFGGDAAVACYAVVSYIVCIIQLLLQGIGDGVQPLISCYFGMGSLDSLKKLRKMAYIFSFSVSAVCMVLIFLLRRPLSDFFGASPAIVTEVVRVLPIFIAGFLFIAFLRITISYLYAIKKNPFAYALIYGESVLLLILSIFVMPRLAGLDGVWMSVPITQGVLSLVGLFFLWLERKAASVPEISSAP